MDTQEFLNSNPKKVKSILSRQLTSDFLVRQIGDISICRYYETGLFVAIRTYPDIVFSVFKTESEAVDYCLDRFQPQLKIF